MNSARSAIHKGVVVGQRHHSGAEFDVSSGLGGVGDEDERIRNELVPAGVVFADPRFFEAQHVHVLQDGQVPLDRVGGVLAHRTVERGHERPELQCHVQLPCWGVLKNSARRHQRVGWDSHTADRRPSVLFWDTP